MIFNSPLWNQLMILIGEIAVVVLIILLATALLLVVITVLSIKSGRLYFPRILIPEFVLLEGAVKAICRLVGVDDKELMEFFIKLHNTMNVRTFEEIPARRRAIFLPQCLRSAKCPASLTPEGIRCRHCGQCRIGDEITHLQDLGYQVFVVPGSSFIKRMVKKYRPKGIIGVGCILEVKEGLEMCDHLGLPAIGVVTMRDGCVETIVDWHELLDAAMLGIETQSVAKDFDVPAE